MVDPHVEKIIYRAVTYTNIIYENPERLIFEHEIGIFELKDDILTITPKEHFSTEDEIRKRVEAFLRSWEIETDLTSNLGEIRFQFDSIHLIDRNPPSGRAGTLRAKLDDAILFSDAVTTILVRKHYPKPPTAFHANLHVQHAHSRWLKFKENQESLQSTAYYVLSLTDSLFKSRVNASRSLNISKNILGRVGEFCSRRGTPQTARKAPEKDYQELTSLEKQWLEEATKLIILRLGEHASGKELSQITMDDLPRLQ